MSEPVLALGACLLLLVAAVLAAALLGWARCPGAAVLGGLAAGVLLGPTILGRAQPDLYERVLVGGRAERERLEAVDRDYQARLVIAESRLDRDLVESVTTGHAAARAPLAEALTQARWEHRQPLRVLALAAVGLTMLLAGTGAIPGEGPRPSTATAMSVGGWAAVLPAATVFVVLDRLLEVPRGQALLAASAVAFGPFVLTAIDREAADRAEIGGARLVRGAGRITCLLALAIAAWGVVAHAGASALPWAVPLLMIVPGWGLGADRSRAVRAARDHVLVPVVAAAVAVRIELYDDFAPWPVLTMLVVSADGRWLGAAIGAMIPGGRRWLRTLRLVMGAMACGPTQLAVAAVALWSGLLGDATGRSLALALMAGVLVIEIGPPIRRAMTRRLSDLEDELSGADGA